MNMEQGSSNEGRLTRTVTISSLPAAIQRQSMVYSKQNSSASKEQQFSHICYEEDLEALESDQPFSKMCARALYPSREKFECLNSQETIVFIKLPREAFHHHRPQQPDLEFSHQIKPKTYFVLKVVIWLISISLIAAEHHYWDTNTFESLTKRASQYPTKLPLEQTQRSQQFLQTIALMAQFSYVAYCQSINEIGKEIPGGHVKADFMYERVSQSLIMYFAGVQLSKAQWSTRKTTLRYYMVPQLQPNALIRVEESWYKDVMAMRPRLSTIAKSILRERNVPIKKVIFTGHGVGGAYAVIAGLTWRIESMLSDQNNRLPGVKLSSFETQVVTFGAPRIGNVIFARLVNKVLDVIRITHGNDHVPHYPDSGSGENLLQHHETEFWIRPNCDCQPGDQADEIFECHGFHHDERQRKQKFISNESLLPEGVMSGENPECNSGQSITDVPNDLIHRGPYFGYEMGNCQNFQE
ncbi:hypothetical protein G9A89_015817 [Geosiphon pyriformis]|nr:hypothetical protein G9A89_015817 [Geosiphon pyriformis]